VVGADGGRLTAFQVQVAQLFFGLPASDGFVLAGGGALLAQGLTARPTQDLDFFTRPGAGNIGLARQQLVAAAAELVGMSTSCRTATHSAACSSTGR
jgi:hypothetical protein